MPFVAAVFNAAGLPAMQALRPLHRERKRATGQTAIVSVFCRLAGRVCADAVGMGAEWLVRGVMRLVDRRAECGKLDGLVEAVCAAQSRALVLSGEAGVGK